MSDDSGSRTRRGSVATIYDVAQLAGVSPSTVSRALSKPGRIAAPTEAKIRAAAEALSFRVNPMARGLHTGRSQTLALLVADITNPVVFGIVRGAEQAASEAGYTLVIAESQESGEAEGEALRRLTPSVDGIILATTRLAAERIGELVGDKPAVLINREARSIPAILPDVDKGVAELVAHLDELGHSSIAYLAGPAASWISDRRWERLLEHTEKRRMAVVEIGPNVPTIEGGRAATRRLRASRASAVVAYNDLLAIGVMQQFAAEGIDVPQDISVSGFDDIFGSELIVPPLTTVRSQLELAGARAANLLVSLVDGHSVEQPLDLLNTELVVRASTGPAPR